jgi:predicted XRE-type DNA-binding protein
VAKKKSAEIEPSSGNVFADLGLPDAVELDTKVRLAVAINQRLAARRMTQAVAATKLSINQPKISALKNYRLEGFSDRAGKRYRDSHTVIQADPRADHGGGGVGAYSAPDTGVFIGSGFP